MRIFELKNKALNSEKGEFLLGFGETGTHSCYMVYGVLEPRDKPRSVKPGRGHEEIILAMRGDLKVTGHDAGDLKEGSAFLIKGDQECFLENRGETQAVYIIAGGHPEAGSH